MEILLWLYVFMTTVVLVNMLIAQMSSTYDRFVEQGSRIAQTGFVQLIRKYQLTNSLPPPLNMLLLPYDLLECYGLFKKKCRARAAVPGAAPPAAAPSAAPPDEQPSSEGKDRHGIHEDEGKMKFHVRMPPVVASYAASRSRKALKALTKKETKREKDSTPARLERLESSVLAIQQAVEHHTELSLTRHAFETLAPNVFGQALAGD